MSHIAARQQNRISSTHPASLLLVVLAAGAALNLVTRASWRPHSPNKAVLVTHGMTQNDALRKAGELILAAHPEISDGLLAADGVKLVGGWGPEWDITCTDSHGADRAAVVWSATGQLYSLGMIDAAQTNGKPIRDPSFARRISDRWIKRLSHYGWDGPWRIRRVLLISDQAWNVDYAATQADASIKLNACTGQLIQARFSPHARRGVITVSDAISDN